MLQYIAAQDPAPLAGVLDYGCVVLDEVGSGSHRFRMIKG